MSRLVSASRVDRHALISTASPHPRPSLSSAMLDKNLYWHPMLLRTPIPASAATSSSTPRPLWHRCYIDPAFPRPRVIKEIGADAVSRLQHHQPSEQRPQQQSETLCKTSGRQTRRLETHFQEKRIAASNPTRLFDSSVDAQPCLTAAPMGCCSAEKFERNPSSMLQRRRRPLRHATHSFIDYSSRQEFGEEPAGSSGDCLLRLSMKQSRVVG
ncbi:hypothetical protein IWX90DRAFT_192364 [Phyllosticta citrichinensis]|uniref:Uncharacterized protein n=1 Tax=Phyllosticta citrichinensis TaxID=1130410 RepID=A0ABR1XXC6_9PEZI